MIKVVVEATPILPRPSGVGLHILSLLKALHSLQESESFQLGIAYQPSLRNWLLGNLSVPEVLSYYSNPCILPLPVRLLNLLAKLPSNFILEQLEDRFNRPDIYHGTNFAVYPCRHSLRVMTIYDLCFIRYPNYVTSVVRTYSHRVKQCLRWTDLVITSAESSKREIVEYLSVPPERIWVTPLASRYAADTLMTANGHVTQKLRGKPYILFVSTLEPRKNIVTLIQAFDLLKSEQSVDHQLLLVGNKGWQYRPIFGAIEASPWKNSIHHMGYLSDEEVAYYYAHADVLAYPSLYEGFGLPVLEAMTLGCPVITSNTSSLPEVVGDAALLVDPNNVEELSDALLTVISDRSLRQSLIDRGKRRASEFSWLRTAKETFAAYRSLL